MEETRPRDRTMSLKKLEDEMMGAYSKTKSRLVKPKPGAPPVSAVVWQSDLFGCFTDVGELLVCMCMPSLTTYNIAVAIGTDKLLAFLYGVLILVPGISEFVLMILYKETAALYGIELDTFLGVLLSYFCTPCLLLQLNNHIIAAGKPAAALPRV